MYVAVFDRFKYVLNDSHS